MERPRRLLFINACILRETSRTNRLAHALVDTIGAECVEEVILEDEGLMPLDSASLLRRNGFVAAGDFSDDSFRHSRQILEYDTVVMASPFYEGMFNGLLKIYLENVSVADLVFRYDEEGLPVGNCHGTLYYVTTRGGYDTDDSDSGVRAMKHIARLFGFDKLVVISANALDIVGNDPRKIIDDAVASIPEKI